MSAKNKYVSLFSQENIVQHHILPQKTMKNNEQKCGIFLSTKMVKYMQLSDVVRLTIFNP